MRGLLVVGAGGHGRVVADAALESGGWPRVAFLDDRHPALSNTMLGPVLGTTATMADWRSHYPDLVVAVGDASIRLGFLGLAEELGYRLPAVVHPRAWVSSHATLGPGSVVMAQAAVQSGAVLGRGCIVNTGAGVDHDCTLGDGVHVAPGAALGGDVVVGERTWVGIGAAVREGVTIGKGVLVAAGSVVVRDVANAARVMGVPARAQGREPSGRSENGGRG